MSPLYRGTDFSALAGIFKTVWRGEAQKYEQTCLFGKFVRKKWSIDVWLVFSGDGRSRTAVQTTHQEAFYTFSRPLVVGRGLPEDGLTEAYPLRLGRI